jgi:glycosyltransferase involved in cell wall biosynthesis
MTASTILLLTQQLKHVRSGVGTYARILCKSLSHSPNRIHLATWEEECDQTAFPGIQFHSLGKKPFFDPSPGAFLTLSKRFARALPLVNVAPNIVHFLDAREAFLPLRHKGKLKTCKWIGTIHDDYAAKAPTRPFPYFGSCGDPIRRWLWHSYLRHLEKKTYPQLDLCLSNSDATTKAIRDAYNLDSSLFRTIPLTLDRSISLPEPKILEGNPALFFAGGNFWRKGLDQVLLALQILRGRVPDPVLHIAGQDKNQKAFRRMARDLGLENRVHFHGRVPPQEVRAMMAGSDIFVLPSQTEALGLVYLEAFSAGIPVISGTEGGCREIVIHEKSGLQVPNGRPGRLALAIEKMVRNGDLRRRVIEGGKQVLEARSEGALLSASLEAYGLDKASVRSEEDEISPSKALVSPETIPSPSSMADSREGNLSKA